MEKISNACSPQPAFLSGEGEENDRLSERNGALKKGSVEETRASRQYHYYPVSLLNFD